MVTEVYRALLFTHFKVAQQTKWASNNLTWDADRGWPGAISVIDWHIKPEGKQVAVVCGHRSWVERKHSCSENTQHTRKATEMSFRVWKCGSVDLTECLLLRWCPSS